MPNNVFAATLVAELQTKVDEERAALRDLMELLEAEREALLSPGVEGLDALSERKTGVARRISALTHQRYTMLADAGCTADEKGMQTFLANPPGGPPMEALIAAWKELGALSRNVKAYNQFNGQLVSGLMARNRDLLAVFGMAAQEGGGLYGPDGRSSRFGKSIRHPTTG